MGTSSCFLTLTGQKIGVLVAFFVSTKISVRATFFCSTGPKNLSTSHSFLLQVGKQNPVVPCFFASTGLTSFNRNNSVLVQLGQKFQYFLATVFS